MAGSVLEIQPGGLRELHWHPTADEWQYILEGKAQIGIFLAEGQIVVDEYEQGDIGYAPMGAGHYIKNTGSQVLKILIGFNDGLYQAIDLSNWIRNNPKSLLRDNFKVSTEIIEHMCSAPEFIVPPKNLIL